MFHFTISSIRTDRVHWSYIPFHIRLILLNSWILCIKSSYHDKYHYLLFFHYILINSFTTQSLLFYLDEYSTLLKKLIFHLDLLIDHIKYFKLHNDKIFPDTLFFDLVVIFSSITWIITFFSIYIDKITIDSSFGRIWRIYSLYQIISIWYRMYLAFLSKIRYLFFDIRI